MNQSLWKIKFSQLKKQKIPYASALLLCFSFILSLLSTAICNDKPLILRYQSQTYFPFLEHVPADIFGETTLAQVDYKTLTKTASFQKEGWALFPPIPFGPNETVPNLKSPPPTPPDLQNILGTDDRGRDLFARLLYGFRNSMIFALCSWALISILAFSLGSLQAYYGGKLDFIGQRFTEVWTALPVLYVIIYLRAVFPPSLGILLLVWVLFSWTALAAYTRAEVLRIRKLDYITSAIAIGASTPRILFRHILPNALTPIITLAPFIIATSIFNLAALDYLGLGLPPPTPSWGELLRQSHQNLQSWWLAIFPFVALLFTLLLLNFIGEGVRQAFDTRTK